MRTSPARTSSALAVLAIALPAGCLPPTTCTVDEDCASGEVCARTSECVAAGSVKTVRVRWTIDGVEPTPAAPAPCAGIDHLVITAYQFPADNQLSFAPVPCTPPQFTFTKLPAEHDRIDLEAEGAVRAFGSAVIPPGSDVTVIIDLQ